MQITLYFYIPVFWPRTLSRFTSQTWALLLRSSYTHEMKSHLPLYLEFFSSLCLSQSIYIIFGVSLFDCFFFHIQLWLHFKTRHEFYACGWITLQSRQNNIIAENRFLAFPVFMCSYLWVSCRKRPSNSYIPSDRYFTNHSHKMLKVVTTGQMVGRTVIAYIICNYLTGLAS